MQRNRTFNAVNVGGIDGRSKHFDADVVLLHHNPRHLDHSATEFETSEQPLLTQRGDRQCTELVAEDRNLVTASGAPSWSYTTAVDGGDKREEKLLIPRALELLGRLRVRDNNPFIALGTAAATSPISLPVSLPLRVLLSLNTLAPK